MTTADRCEVSSSGKAADYLERVQRYILFERDEAEARETYLQDNRPIDSAVHALHEPAHSAVRRGWGLNRLEWALREIEPWRGADRPMHDIVAGLFLNQSGLQRAARTALSTKCKASWASCSSRPCRSTVPGLSRWSTPPWCRSPARCSGSHSTITSVRMPCANAIHRSHCAGGFVSGWPFPGTLPLDGRFRVCVPTVLGGVLARNGRCRRLQGYR